MKNLKKRQSSLFILLLILVLISVFELNFLSPFENKRETGHLSYKPRRNLESSYGNSIGDVVWETYLSSPIYDSIMGDTDNDGDLEIVLALENQTLLCLDANDRNLEWSSNFFDYSVIYPNNVMGVYISMLSSKIYLLVTVHDSTKFFNEEGGIYYRSFDSNTGNPLEEEDFLEMVAESDTRPAFGPNEFFVLPYMDDYNRWYLQSSSWNIDLGSTYTESLTSPILCDIYGIGQEYILQSVNGWYNEFNGILIINPSNGDIIGSLQSFENTPIISYF